MRRGSRWPSRAIPSRPFPKRARGRAREEASATEASVACPACGQVCPLSAAGSEQAPDPATRQALAALALIVHRSRGCPGEAS